MIGSLAGLAESRLPKKILTRVKVSFFQADHIAKTAKLRCVYWKNLSFLSNDTNSLHFMATKDCSRRPPSPSLSVSRMLYLNPRAKRRPSKADDAKPKELEIY